MAVLTLNKNEIEEKIKLTEENLNKIQLMGIPIEVNDNEVTIEITPNRPDLLSLQGFLRAVETYLKIPGLKKYRLNKPEKDYFVNVDDSVKTIRPYTVCCIVKNLKLDDNKIKSIIDMQEKLHSTLGRNRKKLAIGIYPLEKITLPIKYQARKPSEIKFLPLESREEMNGLQILQRHPTGKEYAHLLEKLDMYPIFVDAKNKILSMPPIINSHETGKVSLQTTDVFVECSGFDLNSLNKTLNIISCALADMGGKIYQMEIKYKKEKLITPNFAPEKIKINSENIKKITGLELKEEEIEKLLSKMGYDYKNKTAFVPSWRTDILHEIDVIEDILIGYGYDKLIPSLPETSYIGEESKETKIKSKISEILIGLGLLEISTYHLIKKEETCEKERIELENSKTEYKFLRNDLKTPALRILSENKDNEYPQKIFEIGTIFKSNNEKIEEKNSLLVAYTPSNYTEIKSTLDYLASMLNIDLKIKESQVKDIIEGRSAEILLDNKRIGYIGELHPEKLKSLSIKMPVSLFEIELDNIISKF